jgi:hypothetical protein
VNGENADFEEQGAAVRERDHTCLDRAAMTLLVGRRERVRFEQRSMIGGVKAAGRRRTSGIPGGRT